ncbi:GGDEF domain-containing protein [Shewanella sp. SR44-3]|uniref:GGDEF domain-containing protein n=1 Tax=unclassified Shewanella TaxID=196818 RepID=UPI0021761CD7|nr:GGDEF domain-containing protein [Shewanella sp. SR44-3]
MVRLISVALILFYSVCLSADEQQIEHDFIQLEQALQSDTAVAAQLMSKLFSLKDELTAAQLIRLHIISSSQKLLRGEYKDADIELNKTLNLPLDEASENTVYLYKVTANIGMKQYTKAFTLLEDNLARIGGYGELTIKVSSYLRLVNAYLDMGAYREARQYAETVLELNQGKMVKEQCYALVLLSYAELKLAMLDEAQKGFVKTEAYCEQHEAPVIVAMAIKGKGMLALEHQDYLLAAKLLEDALQRYQTFKFNFEIVRTQALLAQAYYYLERLDQALALAQQVHESPDEPSNLEPKKQANDVQALIAYQNHDFKEAYQFLKLSHALELQLLNDQILKENAYQMAKFDSAEKSRELTNLKQEHELLSKQRDLNNRDTSSSLMFTTLLIGAVVCLSLLLFAAWLQRNRYKQQVQRDVLTGTYNRATGEERAEIDFVQCLARKESYCIIVLDLDRFKVINEKYGHATGDWVLKRLSQIIDENISTEAVLARMGGEEFAIFSPKVSLDNGVKLAELLLQLLQSIDTRHTGHSFQIKASFGVSAIEEDDLSLDPLMHRAVLALQQAKTNGGDQVVSA